MGRRGPKRLEAIPQKFSSIPGIEHLVTAQQLRRLETFLDAHRQPSEANPPKVYDRLGCSSSHGAGVVLRQTLKRLNDDADFLAHIVGKTPNSTASPAVIREYFQTICDLGEHPMYSGSGLPRQLTDDEQKNWKRIHGMACRGLENSSKAEIKHWSTWVVMESEIPKIVHLQNMDPRSAYKWMKSSERSWNILHEFA